MVLLLMLGVLLRPMLLVACEQHAAVFSHPGQPHQHAHDGAGDPAADGSDEADGHGDHQQGQSGAGAGAGAADVPPSLALSVEPYIRSLPPRADAARLVERAGGAPFRPPIA